MNNDTEKAVDSEKQNNSRWLPLIIFLPFILMPIAKCVDERNGVPKPTNPFDPSIRAAVKLEMEKLDSQNLTKEQFEAESEQAFIRELNSRKAQQQ